MHPLFQRRLRPIAVVILVFFSWFCIEPWNFAVAAPPAKPAKAFSKEKGTSEKLEESLHKIKNLTQTLDQDLAADQEIQPRIDQLAEQQKNIAVLDAAILNDFAETEAFLKGKHLPAEILDRHAKALAEYQQNIQTLRKNLDDTVRIHGERKRAKGRGDLKGADQKKGELRAKLKAAKSHLEEKVKEPPHQKLDPNNLPHRMPKVKERKPRLKKEEFTEFQKPIQLAFNGDPSTLMLVQSTPDLPTPADLAETIEVQFTPEIQDLAAQLEHNPVKIYNWVHNNIDYVPTYGSIQGAQMCLMTKQCNDIDTASLLIALLRTSGIAARYVYGTIEVPIEKVMNWVGGFTDPIAALSLIVSGGIPVASVTSGGKIIVARIEHIWVEAFIDYVPSRGAVHKQGDTWVPMDASFKNYLNLDGIDLNPFVGVDGQAIITQAEQGATIDPNFSSVTNINSQALQSSLQNAQSNIVNYVQDNLLNQTPKDIFGGRKIIHQDLRFVPLTLSNKIRVRASNFSQITDNLRHKLTIELVRNGVFLDFSVTKSLPELSTQRITLSYDPASSSEVSIITNAANSGSNSLPAYLINLVPKLKLENSDLAMGSPIGMGAPVTLKISFTDPTGIIDSLDYNLLAGDFTAIGLDLSLIPSQLLSKRVSKFQQVKVAIENQNFNALTKEDFIGEMLNIAMLVYWSESDVANKLGSTKRKIVYVRMPSVGANSSTLLLSKLFGVPFATSPGGLAIDIKRDAVIVKSLDGNKNIETGFMFNSGVLGSSLEGGIYAQIFKSPEMGVSTISVIASANNSGIPIYRITNENIGAILPRLRVDNTVISDIQDAVGSGKIAIVPEQDVTINGWTGTGYILFDPDNGNGAYLISGGLAGGFYRDLLWGSLYLLGFVVGLELTLLFSLSFGTALLIAAAFTTLGFMLSVLLDSVINNRPISTNALVGTFINFLVQFALSQFLASFVQAAGGLLIVGSLAFFFTAPFAFLICAIIIVQLVAIFFDRLFSQISSLPLRRRSIFANLIEAYDEGYLLS